MLVGGCCTDGRAFDGLDAGQRALQGDRSAMVHLLRYGFRRFADRCDAVSAIAATHAPGRWTWLRVSSPRNTRSCWCTGTSLNAQTQRALVAMAHALGPF